MYGIHPVQAALQAGRRHMHTLYLKPDARSERLAEIRSLAARRQIEVRTAPTHELVRLCDNAAHQGAVLMAGKLIPQGERAALALPLRPAPLLLALDEIEDPQNLGAIVRSCAVFRASGVVLPRRHSAALGPAASKASAGTLESYPLFEAANLPRFLQNARKAGYWIAGTAAGQGQPLRSYRRESPLVLVLGNEGRGLRPLVAKRCDLMLSIPTGQGGSLNVSNAAAVLLYQLTLPAGRDGNPPQAG